MRYKPLVIILLFLFSGLPACGLEYPLKAGTQVIFDATTMGVGTSVLTLRYELWILGEREPGKFEAVWVFFNFPRKPDESLAGAIPLTIDTKGTKTFPREREVTYVLQEAIETFIPDLSGVTAFDKVWKGPITVTGRYFSFQPVGQEGGFVKCSFAQYGEDKMDEVIGVLTTGDAFFDPQTSWLRAIELASNQRTPQGPMVTSRASARLVRVLEKDEAWISKRREEAKNFFTALQKHDDLLYKATDDLTSATLTLTPLEQMWQEYLTKNETSLFLALARSHTVVMKSELPVLQGLWLTRKKVVGTTAPGWSLKDPSGTPYSLATLDQRPVLMVFWSKNSWESLMTIRELKQMKQEYEPRGLQILPVNLDANDQDAIKTLNTLQADLVTLRNTDPNLLAAYGIPLGVLPSAVLLDRNHKIAEVRYGWGKRVMKELREKIELVLKP
jgi:peroxiredoxin